MPVHSSVLAISNKPPSIVLNSMSNGELEICRTPARTVAKTNFDQKSVGELNETKQHKNET